MSNYANTSKRKPEVQNAKGINHIRTLYCQASFLKCAFLNFTNQFSQGFHNLMYNEIEGYSAILYFKGYVSYRTYLHIQGIATTKTSHNVP